MTAQLTFNDEFNSLSLWNGSSGTWSTNWWYNDEWGLYSQSNGSTLAGNGEQQWYINANYAPTASVKPWDAQNGVLTITAKPADGAIQGLINNYQYTSGLLNTWHSFSQQYGYFEIRADLPAGQGLWPAFWLLPQDGDWPPELDVFEVLGNDPTRLYTTVHSNASGAHTMATQGVTVADMSNGFHTYGVDWKADTITFYFDGQQVFQTATPADMHEKMYMITNLAVGGGWPGSPDASTPWPAELKVDYIRAWDSNPYVNGGAASTPAPSAPPAGQSGATAGATTGNDVLDGLTDAPNRIRALDGDDRITGGSQFNDVNGNAGADTIIGRSGVGDWLLGGQGSDLIDATASGGRNILNGNMGNDRVLGGWNAETLRGGQGDDVIVGGGGDDWISGDKGYDNLTGGEGADIFHHWGAAGVSVIGDFNQGQGDRVQLDPGTTYHLSQQNSDVVIDLDGGAKLILQNTQLSGLGGGWLI